MTVAQATQRQLRLLSVQMLHSNGWLAAAAAAS